MINVQNKKVIKADELDRLVKRTYGKPYRFQQQDGCKNRGTFHITVPSTADDYENDTLPEDIDTEEMGVSFSAWLARDPKEWKGKNRSYLNMFWERNFYPDIQTLMNDLHSKELISEGEYIIEIDW